MRLTGKEYWLLFWEAIVTIGALLMIDWAVLTMLAHFIYSNPGVENGIFEIKRSINIGPQRIKIWSYQWIAIFLALICDILVLTWRLIRRYHLYQMGHIIQELHYIAEGNFKHRIPYKLGKRLQPIIDSVNALVDAQIKAREDERAVERSKDEMITNVSHDLRTPLTSIIGYLGLIESSQGHLPPADVKKYSHTAYTKAIQMKSLVDDLFEFAQVQQLDMRMKIKKISLTDMLDQLAASFELEAQNKHIKIETMAPTNEIFIEGDPDKLARLFMNLIQNGLKYGEKATYIRLIATIENKYVHIIVANDGIAIPQEAVKHLFDRFYRVESSRSPKTGGTGLGLAISQGVVEAHGGEILARSNSQITEFEVILPIEQKGNKETEDASKK